MQASKQRSQADSKTTKWCKAKPNKLSRRFTGVNQVRSNMVTTTNSNTCQRHSESGAHEELLLCGSLGSALRDSRNTNKRLHRVEPVEARQLPDANWFCCGVRRATNSMYLGQQCYPTYTILRISASCGTMNISEHILAEPAALLLVLPIALPYSTGYERPTEHRCPHAANSSRSKLSGRPAEARPRGNTTDECMRDKNHRAEVERVLALVPTCSNNG